MMTKLIIPALLGAFVYCMLCEVRSAEDYAKAHPAVYSHPEKPDNCLPAKDADLWQPSRCRGADYVTVLAGDMPRPVKLWRGR